MSVYRKRQKKFLLSESRAGAVKLFFCEFHQSFKAELEQTNQSLGQTNHFTIIAWAVAGVLFEKTGKIGQVFKPN